MNGHCRFCKSPLSTSFVNLGCSPLSNSFLRAEDLSKMEPFYPLHALVCEHCFLVQVPKFETPESIFCDYAYFSSYSDIWLDHARRYVNSMIDRFGLNENHLVVELASNDGYLLQYFIQQGIPVLGIEPAANVAQKAEEIGVPTLVEFFGTNVAYKLSGQGKKPNLIVANNVLAHVPNLNAFVAGIKILLGPQGVATLEFPHLVRLIEGNQFDTIYHEHFSYFSFLTVEQVFQAHGLVLFDVEELPTHGGSLRIYACHAEDRTRVVEWRVTNLKRQEEEFGITRLDTYSNFEEKVKQTKRQILRFLIQAKEEGKSVVGYGAPAKGNTLLNYCGVRTDFIDYTVDRSPHKQGLFLPGTRIVINSPDKVNQTRPDYLFVLPWNIKDEIIEQMTFIREWGGRFVVPIPEVTVIA